MSAHWLHGGVSVSRSEWTEGWRLGPLGVTPDGRINGYCYSPPPTVREDRPERRHLYTLHQYGCHQHEFPVCSVTDHSVFVVLFFKMFIRLYFCLILPSLVVFITSFLLRHSSILRLHALPLKQPHNDFPYPLSLCVYSSPQNPKEKQKMKKKMEQHWVFKPARL